MRKCILKIVGKKKYIKKITDDIILFTKKPEKAKVFLNSELNILDWCTEDILDEYNILVKYKEVL